MSDDRVQVGQARDGGVLMLSVVLNLDSLVDSCAKSEINQVIIPPPGDW